MPSNVPGNEAAFAEFYSRTSRVLKWLPPLNWLFVGNNNVPEGWQYIPDAASKLDPWTKFNGDSQGTKLPIPRLYRRVGVLAVDNAELVGLQREHKGARSAVAVRLGQEAVVVGALAEGVDFGRLGNDTERRLIAARIPQSDLVAAAGLWIPEERELVVAESSKFFGRMLLQNVPKAIPVA